jgi:predicted transcriptional regulator
MIMKEPSDSETPNVVSIIDFRNKKIRHPFKDLIEDDSISIFGDDFEPSLSDTPLDFVEQMKALVDELRGDEANYDHLDVHIPPAEVVRLSTILGVLEDALQSLYHCHAVVASDDMWTRAEAIKNQIAAMQNWADKHQK